MAVRTLLVVSEPAMIANPPSWATSPTEGRSASGSSSPLCDRLQLGEHDGLQVSTYEVVEQVLPSRACLQPPENPFSGILADTRDYPTLSCQSV